MNILKNKRTMAYLSLWFVIFVWGTSPSFTKFIFNYYSATMSVVISSVISFIFFFIISIKKLKLLNSTYFKVAVTTGIFYSAADILQKIGLQYTTPTRYAFLENLSCVIVPILLFILIKKKPSPLTIIASLICLASAFLLSYNGAASGGKIGIGEILCALAGLFYGVNIAVTGVYAKKLHATLYLMIQMGVCTIMSTVSCVAFNFITINGKAIEVFKFSFDWKIFLIKCLVSLLVSAICWLIRTRAMVHVSANVVAVMMPMSSIVTAVLSIAIGQDTISMGLILGAVLGLFATVLSDFGDREKKKTLQKKEGSEEIENSSQ